MRTTSTNFAPEILVCDNVKDITQKAHKIIFDALAKSYSHERTFCIALSGGSTPRNLYEVMRSQDAEKMQHMTTLKFIMGDERLVPLDDLRSNTKMARDTVLQGLPEQRFISIDPTPALANSSHIVDGERQARRVADEFEQKLMDTLPLQSVSVDGKNICIPKVNIILLGFGADGHTASIFPDSIASHEHDKSVSVSFPGHTMNPQVWRITLSTTVIQHADMVLVLCAGKDKNWVARGVIEEKPTGRVPVSRFLRQCLGKVYFILDKEAAIDVKK